MDSVKAKFDEYEYLLKLATAKIEELTAENERLKSSLDAHGTLRLIYSNPNLPESLRAKAASAAIQHETPKLMPERAPLELQAEPAAMTLAQLADYRIAPRSGSWASKSRFWMMARSSTSSPMAAMARTISTQLVSAST